MKRALLLIPLLFAVGCGPSEPTSDDSSAGAGDDGPFDLCCYNQSRSCSCTQPFIDSCPEGNTRSCSKSCCWNSFHEDTGEFYLCQCLEGDVGLTCDEVVETIGSNAGTRSLATPECDARWLPPEGLTSLQ